MRLELTRDPSLLHQGKVIAAVAKTDIEKVLNRLRRIEGQVRGLQRMISEDKRCEDVLTQLAATRAALDRVGVYLISHRMKECLKHSSEEMGLDDEAVEEAFEIFMKYIQHVK
ncbi:MAG: metal-sensitive transcriptional regulator [Thermoleophilia bacterium]